MIQKKTPSNIRPSFDWHRKNIKSIMSYNSANTIYYIYLPIFLLFSYQALFPLIVPRLPSLLPIFLPLPHPLHLPLPCSAPRGKLQPDRTRKTNKTINGTSPLRAFPCSNLMAGGHALRSAPNNYGRSRFTLGYGTIRY